MNPAMLAAIQDDPMRFFDALRVNAAGDRFGDVKDPRQDQDLRAMVPALKRLIGWSDDGRYCNRFWWGRGRGGAKSQNAVMAIDWLLVASPRRVTVRWYATDLEQAGVSIEKQREQIEWSPVLSEVLEINKGLVRNKHTGSELIIGSSDVASSFGITPDFVVIDELSHAPESGEDLLESMYTAVCKKPDAILLLATNAGFIGSWAWNWREKLRDDPAWCFSEWDAPAKWLTAEGIAELSRGVRPNTFQRLVMNRWTSNTGTAFTESIFTASLAHGLDGPIDHLPPGHCAGIGCDIGISRDSSAVVACVRDTRTGVFKLAHVKTWTPTETTKVNVEEVEAYIRKLYSRFRGKVLLDQHQGAYVCQRLSAARVNAEMYFYTPSNEDSLARYICGGFEDAKIALYEHPRLLSELRATSVVERTSGKIRLSWPRSSGSHCDGAAAFVLAIKACSEARAPIYATRRPRWRERDPNAFDARQRRLAEQELRAKYGDSIAGSYIRRHVDRTDRMGFGGEEKYGG